jgi:trimeric autotransporter adhesin
MIHLLLSFPGLGVIYTVAGNGSRGDSGDSGLAISALLDYPNSIAFDSTGDIYIADTANHRIRKVTKSTGIITTVAGDGTEGYSGDEGQAASAIFSYPYGVSVGASGNIYVADTYNHRIRMIAKSTGIITTVAGNGTQGYSGDGGQATSAILQYPCVAAIDASGNLLIADTFNNCIRMVTLSTGVITTVAGNGNYGYTGDGGPATSATLSHLYGAAVDASGNIFISDTVNSRIRMVTKSTGIITTVAGDGSYGFTGDGGRGTSARLSFPYGVTVDASGNIFFADSANNCIRMVTKSTGIISTVAGNRTAGYSGDGGQALSATLSNPLFVALYTTANIYIADAGNDRIRVFELPPAPTASPTVFTTATPRPSGVTFTAKPSVKAEGNFSPVFCDAVSRLHLANDWQLRSDDVIAYVRHDTICRYQSLSFFNDESITIFTRLRVN